ncbi:MAG: 4Fe-4S cluster-binding domain-containing protein [Endomicrobiaceae bacterium]|nr:4Fe-4S cluster-binding domain-containing protein [Endomicrobiaceae bacterium]
MNDNNKFEITWLPLWKCNFQCPYCLRRTNTNALEFQPLNTIIKVWDNLFHKLQDTETEIELNISGGEPTLYPNIFEILKCFTKDVLKIHVYTNFSFNAYDFLNLKLSSEKIFFHATFHPAYMSLDNFINNLILLKEYVKDIPVTFVADENNLKKQKEFIKKINDCGIKVKPLFLKNLGQDTYPEKEYGKFETLNSEKEIKLIKEIRSEQNQISSDCESVQCSPFGKKCLAGYRSIQIFPNGNIRKCSMDLTYLGNIFDRVINLYKEPQICTLENCPPQYRNIID